MTQKTQVKIKLDKIPVPLKMIQAILEELRLLRNEVMLLFPQEDLKDYAHPDRIKRSYKEALKKYPPVSL